MRVLRTLVVGVVLAVLLAACTDDDPDPKIAPSETVASTPSSSAPTTSPSPDPLTPEETVRAWVKAQNEALSTGDTSDMRRLSAPQCRGCQNFAETIEQVYAAGGRYETDGWTVVEAKARSLKARPVVVTTGVSVAGGRTTPEAGADPVVYDEEVHLMVFKLVPHQDAWWVLFIGFVS